MDLNLTEYKSITSGERSRRQGLVESLLRSEQELRFSMAQSSITKTQRKEEKQRKELMTSDGGGISDLGDIQWGASTKKSNIRFVFLNKIMVKTHCCKTRTNFFQQILNFDIFSSNYGTANDTSSAGFDHTYDNTTNLHTGSNFNNILSEQDRGLDSLHNVIVRSRIAAENIESEVGVQNEIIDGLGNFKSYLT